MRRSRGWLVAAAVLLAGCAIVRGGQHPSSNATGPTPTTSATPSPGSVSGDNQDPARFAAQVRRYASSARIDPRLLMAILYNESYKPHDPSLERAWQRLKPDAAFGVANMHQATFNQVKQGRDFAARDWQQLPDDPALAIEAAAWYLHDLAASLPSHYSADYTRDELLALGYNTGPGNMRAFARGVTPGSSAQAYLDRLHANWAAAGRAITGG